MSSEEAAQEVSDIRTLFTSKLQSGWSFWYDDRKTHQSETTDFKEYQQSLKQLGSFNTMEDFWRHYSFITNPDSFPRECTLYLIKDGAIPAWESFPDGGCWIVRVRKRNTLIDRLWEELCFACVGELFDNPDLVCVAVSTRHRDDILSIWNKDNVNPNNRFVIGEKLKELLNLDESTQVDYKTFKSALKDGSSFKNARSYVYAPPATNLATVPPVFITKDQQ